MNGAAFSALNMPILSLILLDCGFRYLYISYITCACVSASSECLQCHPFELPEFYNVLWSTKIVDL